jgi:hypothetical protein
LISAIDGRWIALVFEYTLNAAVGVARRRHADCGVTRP